MANAEPIAEIVEATRHDDVSVVAARFDLAPMAPIAPGALYAEPKSGNEQFQLHKLIRVDGRTLTFQTLNSAHSLPKVGERYFFRSWWVKPAMEAALDTDAIWMRQVYPDDGTHQHCLFSWEAIEANSANAEGYWSQKHGWITVRAYENFIRDDIYRIRANDA